MNHAAEARNYIAVWEEKAGNHAELDMALAQVHATLALVEQLRISNEIELRKTKFPLIPTGSASTINNFGDIDRLAGAIGVGAKENVPGGVW